MTDDPEILRDSVRARVKRHLLQVLAGGMALGVSVAAAQTIQPPGTVVDPIPPPWPCGHPNEPPCWPPGGPPQVVDPPPPPFRCGDQPCPPPPKPAK